MDPMMIVGTIGAALILIAFMGNEWNFMKASSLKYDLLNLLGSILLVAYAIDGRVWPFVILNGVWLAVSLRDVVKGLGKTSSSRT